MFSSLGAGIEHCGPHIQILHEMSPIRSNFEVYRPMSRSTYQSHFIKLCVFKPIPVTDSSNLICFFKALDSLT